MLEIIKDIDKSLFFAVNSLAGSPFVDNVNIFLSSSLVWIIVFIVFASYALWKGKARGKKAVLVVVASVAFTDAFTFKVLKENIERLRPCVSYKESANTPSGCKSQFGFPSNHAANSGAIASAVYFVGYKKLGLVFTILAVMVSLSRVFLGVHYPGDIFVGMISGALYSFLIVKAVNWYLAKRKATREEDSNA